MHHTKNDMPEKTRAGICAILQERMSDGIDLMLQAKQAHWNVKGPHFITLHELFDKVWEQTVEYVDLVAERIVQLGGTAQGTIRSSSTRTTLPEYPHHISDGKDHVASLSHAIAVFGESVRRAINQANEVNDMDTADILTEISRGNDKSLWMVEAHIQAEK